MTVVLIISLDLKKSVLMSSDGKWKENQGHKNCWASYCHKLFFIFFWGDVTVILQDKSTIPISIIVIFTWERCNVMVNFQLYACWGFSLKLTDALRYVLTIGFELLGEGPSFLLSSFLRALLSFPTWDWIPFRCHWKKLFCHEGLGW